MNQNKQVTPVISSRNVNIAYIEDLSNNRYYQSFRNMVNTNQSISKKSNILHVGIEGKPNDTKMSYNSPKKNINFSTKSKQAILKKRTHNCRNHVERVFKRKSVRFSPEVEIQQKERKTLKKQNTVSYGFGNQVEVERSD